MSKILLVESDRALCAFLKELFTEEGFQVGVAHTGQQALDLLEREGGWVVWLDVGLRRMSGREVVRALRDTPHLLDENKVILTSASRKGRADAQRELSEVVVSALPQSFDFDEVLTLIRRMAG